MPLVLQLRLPSRLLTSRCDAVNQTPSLLRHVQERAWVTGLQAANLVIQRLGQGRPADILPGAWAGQGRQGRAWLNAL